MSSHRLSWRNARRHAADRAHAAFDDLDALLAECGVAAPVLVGHSLGGNLAQAFARAHPERTRGLIVLDSAWNAGPPPTRV